MGGKAETSHGERDARRGHAFAAPTCRTAAPRLRVGATGVPQTHLHARADLPHHLACAWIPAHRRPSDPVVRSASPRIQPLVEASGGPVLDFYLVPGGSEFLRRRRGGGTGAAAWRQTGRGAGRWAWVDTYPAPPRICGVEPTDVLVFYNCWIKRGPRGVEIYLLLHLIKFHLSCGPLLM